MVADKKDIEKVARKLEHSAISFRARDPDFRLRRGPAPDRHRLRLGGDPVRVTTDGRCSGALANFGALLTVNAFTFVREISVPAAALELGADVHQSAIPGNAGQRRGARASRCPSTRSRLAPPGWKLASRNKSVSPAAA